MYRFINCNIKGKSHIFQQNSTITNINQQNSFQFKMGHLD